MTVNEGNMQKPLKSSKRNAEIFRVVPTRGSTWLQVVGWDKTWPAVLTYSLSLPPSIVLEPKHSKNVALLESELFRDLCCVRIHCASCVIVSDVLTSIKTGKNLQ
jgi:hypothetical protein